MAVLPIIKVGHPTLRKVAKRVEKFDEILQKVVDDLIETMRVNEGIGLAAPQVNIAERFFVIDKKLINEDWEAQAYINPEILSTDGLEKVEEGCLSIPGVRLDVVRPFSINVRYQNTEGETIDEQMEDLLARVFQHENDHLNGVLFIDKINDFQRKLIEPRLREIEGVYAYR